MDVIEPRFRWAFPAGISLPPDVAAAAATHGLSERLASVLVSRGVADGPALDAWFADPLDALHDPLKLPDIGLLLDRLALARSRGERVLVFGDFDADGLTGLAILVIALARYGVQAEPYVPSRLDEGHGLSLAALDAAERSGATVIVTVDCGSTSHAEIAAAVAARDRRDRDRSPPGPGGHAAGARARQSPPPRFGVPGQAPRRQRCRLQGRAGAACGPARRTRRGPCPDRSRDHRDRRRRGADRRREPRHRPAGPRAPAPCPATRHRRTPGAGAHRTGGGRSRDDLVRPRAPAQCGRPDGGGGRGRPTLARRIGRGGRGPRRRPRGREPRAPGPRQGGADRGAGPGRRDRGPGGDADPRPVDRRHRRAGRSPSCGGSRPAGRRRRGHRRHDPRVVPERWQHGPGCRFGTLWRPLHAVRWPCRCCRLRAAGRPLAGVLRPLPGRGGRDGAARPTDPVADRPRAAGPRRRLRAAPRARRVSLHAVPGTRSRSSRCSA